MGKSVKEKLKKGTSRCEQEIIFCMLMMSSKNIQLYYFAYTEFVLSFSIYEVYVKIQTDLPSGFNLPEKCLDSAKK